MSKYIVTLGFDWLEKTVELDEPIVEGSPEDWRKVIHAAIVRCSFSDFCKAVDYGICQVQVEKE